MAAVNVKIKNMKIKFIGLIILNKRLRNKFNFKIKCIIINISIYL